MRKKLLLDYNKHFKAFTIEQRLKPSDELRKKNA